MWTRDLGRRRFPFLAALVAALAQNASASVWIVDPSGAGDFSNIHSAVAAAVDGDTLIVRAGAYAGFTIDDESLWILAEQPGMARVTGTIVVRNLAAAKSVVLFGIQGDPTAASTTALRLTSNVGHVRAHNCTFEGAPGAPVLQGGDGAVIESCLSVVFQECVFAGGEGFDECNPFANPCSSFDSGGDGASTDLSIVAFYDCVLTGGDGDSNNWLPHAGNAGHGCNVLTFGIFASGSTFQGGNGGYADDWKGPEAGDGGHGVKVSAGAQAQLLDNSYGGGSGGAAPFGHPGTPGSATGGSGNAHVLNGAKRFCFADPLVGSGQMLSVTLIGQPGDRVYLPSSPRSNWSYAPLLLGVWLLPLPAFTSKVPIAVIPASGITTAQIRMPTLPPAEPLRRIFAQAIFRTVQGQAILGSGLTIAVRN